MPRSLGYALRHGSVLWAYPFVRYQKEKEENQGNPQNIIIKFVK